MLPHTTHTTHPVTFANGTDDGDNNNNNMVPTVADRGTCVAILTDDPDASKPWYQRLAWWCTSLPWVWATTTVLVLVVVGVTLLTIQVRADSSTTPVYDPRAHGEAYNRTAYYVALRDVLLSSSDDAPVVWTTPGSPMERALAWMTLDDPLAPLPFFESHATSDEQAKESTATTLYAYERTRLHQRFALCVLYYTWAGPTWTLEPSHGWLHRHSGIESSGRLADQSIDATHECLWLGVTCTSDNRTSDDHRVVTGLDFGTSNAALKAYGTIPEIVGRLTHLQNLLVFDQQLQGPLPTTLFLLTNLQALDVNTNRLTAIPEALGDHLVHLHTLHLYGNEFRGTLPASFTQLTLLENLRLDDNPALVQDDFWSTMLPSWPLLRTVVTSSTGLGGSLPTEIGTLRQLATVSSNFAPISGTLPTELGLCTGMVQFNVNQPQAMAATTLAGGFQGTLPTELGRWSNLRFLALRGHANLVSTLPWELASWTNVQLLDLDQTAVRGTLPAYVSRWSQLNRLVLSSTDLTGTIPSELGMLSDTLTSMELQDTDLVGTVPVGLCNGGGGVEFVISCDGSAGPNGRDGNQTTTTAAKAFLVCDCCRCLE